MQFFDLHVHSAFSGGESSIEQLAIRARQLGYRGICFAEYFKNENQIKNLKEEIQKVKEKIGIEIFLGFEARNVKELKYLAKIRKRFDILLAHGGDLKMNKEACETPEVDILTHPEYERRDQGLNHVLVKEAARNGVGIEVNFREILMASKKTRANVMANIGKNIKLAKKYKAKIVVCSGAISEWELRDPIILSSFGNLLGMELKEAEEAIGKNAERIIEKIKKRKSEKWIMPGVRVIG